MSAIQNGDNNIADGKAIARQGNGLSVVKAQLCRRQIAERSVY